MTGETGVGRLVGHTKKGSARSVPWDSPSALCLPFASSELRTKIVSHSDCIDTADKALYLRTQPNNNSALCLGMTMQLQMRLRYKYDVRLQLLTISASTGTFKSKPNSVCLAYRSITVHYFDKNVDVNCIKWRHPRFRKCRASFHTENDSRGCSEDTSLSMCKDFLKSPYIF